jgi:SnoaL-like protein
MTGTDTVNAWSPERARSFAARWLPAWTGNQPDLLASYYTDDAFYADPAVPDGVQGQAELLGYFRRLLARNPNWIWRQRRATPLEDGFLNHWEADIPVGDEVLTVEGVCAVQLRGELIYRNEVFFDRSELLRAAARRTKN